MYVLNALVNFSCTYMERMSETAYESYSIDRLSAYLFEETQDPIYYEAAQLSADFMIRYMWSGSTVYYDFSLHTCTANSDLQLTVFQSGFIEGVISCASSLPCLTSFCERRFGGVG